MTDSLRAGLRLREPLAVTPTHSLEDAGRELVGRGVTNETELKRIFGL